MVSPSPSNEDSDLKKGGNDGGAIEKFRLNSTETKYFFLGQYSSVERCYKTNTLMLQKMCDEHTFIIPHHRQFDGASSPYVFAKITVIPVFFSAYDGVLHFVLWFLWHGGQLSYD